MSILGRLRRVILCLGFAPRAPVVARAAPVLALMSLAGCKHERPQPIPVAQVRPHPMPVAQVQPQPPHRPRQPRLGRGQIGIASWYGRAFAGKRTASGERFDPNALTAAHRTLPLGSTAKVTDTASGYSVQVRINDRGPLRRGRIIDLSRQAAMLLDMTHDGVTEVRVQLVLQPEG
jgi:rare lipoprotein A